jgi:hypothetical protein
VTVLLWKDSWVQIKKLTVGFLAQHYEHKCWQFLLIHFWSSIISWNVWKAQYRFCCRHYQTVEWSWFTSRVALICLCCCRSQTHDVIVRVVLCCCSRWVLSTVVKAVLSPSQEAHSRGFQPSIMHTSVGNFCKSVHCLPLYHGICGKINMDLLQALPDCKLIMINK